MKNKITLILMCFLCLGSLFAQERECSTMENLEYRKQLDPQLERRMEQIEEFTEARVSEMQTNRIDGDIITIPVVVHVLYRNNTENISEAQIQSQMDVLNEDFRRTNPDADNTWSQAADSQIQFCMASVDPNGNATTGITRKSTTRQDWGTSDDMKRSSQGGVDPWDTSQYLNMWIVPRMTSGGRTILGYAQFPGGSAATDGVVMAYNYFGRVGNVSAPFDGGRTTTHEVGHFLNLRHIWGDANCGNDFVADTPTHQTSNGGCPVGQVSCGSTDMVQNYMDYTNDSCMNLFTQGQADRMRAVLAPGGPRRALALSDKCGGGGTTPTCSDGVQNGDETGVDCGGSSCAPCQTGCSENQVNVSITFDNYPEETAWTLTNSSNQTVASGSYSSANPDGSTVSEDLCLPDDCYTFTITDAYGDGICCSYGNGSYSVTGPSGSLASGGSFSSSEATDFCLGGAPAPTCTDGIQNGDETGVDCGGSSCAPCVTPPTCDDGIQNGDETGIDCGGSSCAPCSTGGSDVLNEGYFESGWDGWSDGGSDCYRYRGSRSYEGQYSIRIRDNSGTASAMTSPSFDLRNYNQVEVEFYFYAYSMENGEDFWLRYYNGSSWTTVATYASGTNFNNNTFYTATVTLDASQYNFAANSQFRFQCDASANADQIYIDQVKITGISSGNTRSNSNDLTPLRTLDEGPVDAEEDFLMYPNPVKGETLYIKTFSKDDVSYRVINMLGQTMVKGKTSSEINVSGLKSGMYFLEVNDGEEVMTRKFIKQ
ncbi:M43 family zinc metalloprotease [Winogradskyella flava]|uniref:T9SS type A sorting domain-containing protein n=1 Tax=Winogradskyella flava TaxID=1884876 RepID=A0A842IKI0_9FLAO|nr:M43 family zinc metalloprotease [Winogradskyella flava]MBC2843792.1 T9SS type A sorting domain-containing protein [Winogradskyella flava]